VGGIELLAGAEDRAEERPEAGTPGPLEGQEPELREDPILPQERHDVGDSSQRDERQGFQQEVPEGRRELLRPREALRQGPHELERHPDAREVLERIRAARRPGIDDRDRGRQDRSRLMMVGHHDVDAQLAGGLNLPDRRRAVVHGDDERDARGSQFPHRPGTDSVALAEPIGKAVRHGILDEAEEIVEQARRGNAIDVVVPEDRDPLLRADGTVDPLDRLLHVGKTEGIVEVAQLRRQEAAGILGLAHAPPVEEHREEGRAGEAPREAFPRVSRGLSHSPLRFHHAVECSSHGERVKRRGCRGCASRLTRRWRNLVRARFGFAVAQAAAAFLGRGCAG
jgi:hypothetical protein